ncbi:MAG: 2-oxoacid:acceptor oxidoreductase subunit alpha [Dethiobacter sp.]|jgi:2-oxoglutarate ferredoxin oxidoreductase subunit alpha|nr:2-oxoacid:acceptor oxidoreductase subunit alpha [Dethiobacter sp.]MBS3983426.1 2-oxoacid:acceptor oxidoreductase subunit alpha [Dethiobacter sp.]MCL4463360.1 2-oxoacid:acceptor oxidoreductase subunit alpha [Bacillota bacterium]MCL5992566.1 2-oxoacid:acceptor oxidoreductase subunit alpha [Bacillota bacterium]
MIKQRKLMQGNEACVFGALYAGLNFFAGYPITPSTEIAETLARKLPAIGGNFIQMEDEIASIAACIGASLAGAKAMTATSGPGFSLMQENIGYAIMTEIPCVVVNVQRLGPSTGGPTAPAQGDVMQARWGTHGDHEMVVLTPAGVEEVFTLTVKAFNIAETLRTPVILLMDEVIAHLREGASPPEAGELLVVARKEPKESPAEYLPFKPQDDLVPVPASFGTGYRYHVTGLYHDEAGFPTGNPEKIDRLVRRLKHKIILHQEKFLFYEEYLTNDADIILISYGASARSAKAAVNDARAVGISVGLLRLITLWPFPSTAVSRICANASVVITAEMNLGQIYAEVCRVLDSAQRTLSVTHVDGTLIAPQKILAAIKEAAK